MPEVVGSNINSIKYFATLKYVKSILDWVVNPAWPLSFLQTIKSLSAKQI